MKTNYKILLDILEMFDKNQLKEFEKIVKQKEKYLDKLNTLTDEEKLFYKTFFVWVKEALRYAKGV